MIVELDKINRVLERVGLLLIVRTWDGQGDRVMPRDATKLEIITTREWARRIEGAA